MDIDSITPDQFNALSEAEQMALLDGGSLGEPVQESSQLEAVQDVPQGVAAEEAASVPRPSVDAQIPQGKTLEQALAELENYKRAMHEERGKRQSMEQLLNDPGFFNHMQQQQSQQAAPELTLEDPEAIRYLINESVAPYIQQLQQIQYKLHQSEQREQMASLRGQYPDIDNTIAEFNTKHPDHMNTYDPVAKHLMVMGMRASDPQAMQSKIEEAANARAQELVQQALSKANGGKQAPFTLGNVPPARSHDQGKVDINSLSDSDFGNLSDAEIQRMRSQF